MPELILATCGNNTALTTHSLTHTWHCCTGEDWQSMIKKSSSQPGFSALTGEWKPVEEKQPPAAPAAANAAAPAALDTAAPAR